VASGRLNERMSRGAYGETNPAGWVTGCRTTIRRGNGGPVEVVRLAVRLCTASLRNL